MLIWPNRRRRRVQPGPSADRPIPGRRRHADHVDLAVARAAVGVDENPGICIGDPSIFQSETFDERQRVPAKGFARLSRGAATPFEIDAQPARDWFEHG